MSSKKTTRRRFLKVGSAAVIAGLAGCTGDASDNGSETTADSVTTNVTSETSETSTNETMGSGSTTEGATSNATSSATETETEFVTPHDKGSIHLHGFLTFEVDGKRVDYDETRFYEKVTSDPNFHFHKTKNDKLTHVHAKDVTVHYALNSLPGISVGRRSTIELAGKTYSSTDEGTSISITVNNELVDPRTYVLEESDHIEIIIETSSNSTATANTTSASDANSTTNTTETTGVNQ